MVRRALQAFGVIGLLLGTACGPKPRPLAPGDAAPEFSLMGSDGKAHRLSDYRGKFVVVAWFPKAFTGG